jgi:hypothetical protein
MLKRSSLLRRVSVWLVLVIWALPVQATLYIYQGPRGEVMVSNVKINEPKYRLKHERKSVENVGHLAAGRKGPQGGNATIFGSFGNKYGRSSYSSGRKLVNTTVYDGYIRSAALRYGVDPALVKAVIQVESNFDPAAVSRAGARGLMQLMPGTAARYDLAGQQMFLPHLNIEAGVQHLAYLKTLFPNNIDFVLAAYNAGERNVVRYNGIPPFKETVNYVQKVNSSRQYFNRAFF